MGDAIGLPDQPDAVDVQTVFAQGLLRMTDLGLLDWHWVREHDCQQEYAVLLRSGDAPLEVTVDTGDNGNRLMVALNEVYAPAKGRRYNEAYSEAVSRLHDLVADQLMRKDHRERTARGQG